MDVHALECLDFPRIRELLAEAALTGLGRGLALQIRPTARAELIQRWLRQVEELQQLEEQRGLPPFGGITDVREIVSRCAPPLRVTVEEMAAVGDALAGTRAITQYFQDLPEPCAELRILTERIGDFGTVATRISAVINERGQVRDDASPKLQRIRRDIEQATSEIGVAVDHLLRDPSVRKLLQYPNPTFHNDRIVLPVRAEYRGRLAGIVHRTSDTGATEYVEPAQAVELNNQIVNLRITEQEECNRLLWDLAHEVHLNEREIIRALDALAVLDLAVAKVRLAHTLELRCPKVNQDGLLRVRQARHPLLVDLARRRSQTGESPADVVPIDYRIGEDFDLLVITGPNTGGKTVTLKTIGLINLMVQAGLPVPVGPGSEVGLFRDIMMDIGDEQSMQQSLSTFSAHLKRLLDMLRRAGQKTLVLIDELGAGTDPDEGAAIGKAMLDELLRLGTRCVATTHLGALKSYPLTRPRAENACVEFDVETLRPTYHLRIGESGSSNAIDVAMKLGMPRRLAAAARKNLSKQARVLAAALRGTAGVKRKAEDARQAAESAKLEAEKAHGEAHQARARLEQQQAEFQAWVQRVVHLQPGDAVRVRNFDRDGKVVRVKLDQQRAEIDVGAFAVEVPLGDILPPETAPPPPPLPRPAAIPVPPAPPRPKRRERPPRPADRPPRSTDHPPREARPDKPRERQAGPPPERHPDARGQRPPSRPVERPVPPSLKDDEAEKLEPGELVYVKRFHRIARVARVNFAKKLVSVSMGLLEIEVPYDGLAWPASRTPPQPPQPRPPRREPQPAAEQAASAAPSVSATAPEATATASNEATTSAAESQAPAPSTPADALPPEAIAPPETPPSSPPTA